MVLALYLCLFNPLAFDHAIRNSFRSSGLGHVEATIYAKVHRVHKVLAKL